MMTRCFGGVTTMLGGPAREEIELKLHNLILGL